MKKLIGIILAISFLLSTSAYAQTDIATLGDFIGEYEVIHYDECTQKYFTWTIRPDQDIIMSASITDGGMPEQGQRLKYLFQVQRTDGTDEVRIYSDGTVTLSKFDSDKVDKCCKLEDFDAFYSNIEKYFTTDSEGYGISIPGKQQTLKISEWAVEEYNYAREKELLPSCMIMGFMTENISREQFCELVTNLIPEPSAEETYTDNFVDTDNPDVLRLADMGIINGKSETKFAPNDLLTREEAATILFRLVREVFGNVNYVSKLVDSFDDYDDISEYAAGYVMGMCVMGVMNGVGDNRFDPKGVYTIEQAVATVVRLYKLAVNKEPVYEYDTPLGILKSSMDYDSYVNFAIECEGKVQLVKDSSDYVNSQYTVVPVVKAFTDQDTSQYISFDSFANIFGGEWKLTDSENRVFEFTYDTDVTPDVEPYNKEISYGTYDEWPNKSAFDGVMIFADIPQIIVNGNPVELKKSVGGKFRNGNIIMVNSELYIPVWMVAQLGGYESAYISIIWE